MSKSSWISLGLGLALFGCGAKVLEFDSKNGPSEAGASGTGSGGGVTIPAHNEANKVDLLVMVDNSVSMADKQALLSEALPALVHTFITPPTDGNGQPLYAAVEDIHLGVITSSLGGHGGDICSETSAGFDPMQNDHAHLIDSVRPGLWSYNNQGFLWWDPLHKFGGEQDPAKLVQDFQAHVQAASEFGCGYEASLESWYRFLVDPEPPLNVTHVGDVTTLYGIDEVILQQRKDFLRPDSLVIILMLSDENDCSIAETGTAPNWNWIFAQASGGGGPFHLPRGTQACETDPDGACCRSCASVESAPPPGCASKDDDSNCQMGDHDELSDHLNLRCWRQKQRFGIDALYPTRRYVDALTKPTVPSRSGVMVANPLFADLTGGGNVRALDNVLFVPIVGVPWQDITIGSSYLSAQEIADQGRWDWLVPQCKTIGPDGACDVWDLTDQPDDPLMIESVLPRSGINPATNVSLAAPVAALGANPINGHEYIIGQNHDLQYACIFELSEPRDCTSMPGGCDCAGDPSVSWNPLCQQADGSYSSIQRFAKAYPGTRQLQVAKDLGTNAVIGSVCSNTYLPVVHAIARQLPGRLVK
jgi:hypothetical protein